MSEKYLCGVFKSGRCPHSGNIYHGRCAFKRNDQDYVEENRTGGCPMAIAAIMATLTRAKVETKTVNLHVPADGLESTVATLCFEPFRGHNVKVTIEDIDGED